MKWQPLFLACLLISINSVAAQDEPPNPAPTAVEGEPLLRGPIHEAFAEPLSATEDEPLVVPTEPPAPVEELPPEAKPEGANTVWIPGYWAWDEEREDYIWVSGTYRRAPHGRSWVPGEWIQVDDGYEWSPGYWAADGITAEERIPAPPPTLDQGPTSEAPSEDHFWVPGCWQYRAQRYAWRPGFWSPSYDNWVWVPDHFVTGPAGCVYVRGYWDYPWETRGTLYAPCYFNYASLVQRSYYYRPSLVVDVSGAFFHLWVRPRYCHYYYGDYYDVHYRSYGYLPWHHYHHRYRRAYDPLFVHYHRRFRKDRVDLYHHLDHRHRHLTRHTHARPARHFDHSLHSRGRHLGKVDHARRAVTGKRLARDVEKFQKAGGRRALLASRSKGHLANSQVRREAIRRELLKTHREQLREGLVTEQRVARPARSIGNRRPSIESIGRKAQLGLKKSARSGSRIAEGQRSGTNLGATRNSRRNIDRAGPDADTLLNRRRPRASGTVANQDRSPRRGTNRVTSQATSPPGKTTSDVRRRSTSRDLSKARRGTNGSQLRNRQITQSNPGDRGVRTEVGRGSRGASGGGELGRRPIPNARDRARSRIASEQASRRASNAQNTKARSTTQSPNVNRFARPGSQRNQPAAANSASRNRRATTTNRAAQSSAARRTGTSRATNSQLRQGVQTPRREQFRARPPQATTRNPAAGRSTRARTVSRPEIRTVRPSPSNPSRVTQPRRSVPSRGNQVRSMQRSITPRRAAPSRSVAPRASAARSVAPRASAARRSAPSRSVAPRASAARSVPRASASPARRGGISGGFNRRSMGKVGGRAGKR